MHTICEVWPRQGNRCEGVFKIKQEVIEVLESSIWLGMA